MYVYTYTHIHTHVYTQIYLHTYNIYVRVHGRACASVQIHAFTYIPIHLCIYAYLRI